MKTKIILFICLISTVVISHAQTVYQSKNLMEYIQSKRIASGEWNNELKRSDIKGSPYLDENFINGTIYTMQKEKYENVPMRYNIYSDDIEFKSFNGDALAIAAPETLEKVEIGNHQFYYIPYILSKKIEHGYFERIEGENASLFTRYEVIFKDAEAAGAYKDASPAQFVRKMDEYFIRVGDEPAAIITNKKDLIDIFPDHKNEVEVFIKKHKTKTNKVDSLAELVKYYNSL